MTTQRPTAGQRIALTETAPVSAQFMGRTGTVKKVLPNAILIDIEGHGSALVHLTWPKGGALGFTVNA